MRRDGSAWTWSLLGQSSKGQGTRQGRAEERDKAQREEMREKSVQRSEEMPSQLLAHQCMFVKKPQWKSL